MRVFNPYTVTILTTDKCTAECRHCSMNSSPERTEMLSYERMKSILGQFFENFPMRVVVFAGGEPTLLGDDLLKIIRFCKDNGVISRIVTNAYWATSPEAAVEKCRELREAGLDEINVSMDDYHEPWVPFERVKWAYEAAVQFDFMSIVMANCGGPESVLTPERLEKEFGMDAGTMQRRFDVDGVSTQMTRNEEDRFVILSNGTVQRLGRGCDLVADEEYDDSFGFEEKIEDIGGCPWAVKSPAITSRGHLVSCCGFELAGNPILDFGDVDDGNLTELVDKANDDLITNMIAILGPPKIKELLLQLCPDEVEFPRQRYLSYCETCQDLVGIEKNRRALYKYQGLFTGPVLAGRNYILEEKEAGRQHWGVRVPGVEVRRFEDEPELEADKPEHVHEPLS